MFNPFQNTIFKLQMWKKFDAVTTNVSIKTVLFSLLCLVQHHSQNLLQKIRLDYGTSERMNIKSFKCNNHARWCIELCSDASTAWCNYTCLQYKQQKLEWIQSVTPIFKFIMIIPASQIQFWHVKEEVRNIFHFLKQCI